MPGLVIPFLSMERPCDVFGKGGMGFRDLSCFKMALLARQGWRIMTHPDAFCLGPYSTGEGLPQ